MKANESPKNLYLSSTGKLKDGISTGRFCDTDIEYTRTDLIVERTVKYIANHFLAPGMDNEINDFINYMKEE